MGEFQDTAESQAELATRIKRMTVNEDGTRFVVGQKGASSGIPATDPQPGMKAIADAANEGAAVRIQKRYEGQANWREKKGIPHPNASAAALVTAPKAETPHR
jgi:hypothetical protein